MSEATDILRKHVNYAGYTTSHRVNCLDVCDEVDVLTACVASANKYLETKDPEAALAVLLRGLAT